MKNKTLYFPDYPNFTPNKTPKEILQEGCFGGTYFRPIFSSISQKKYKNCWKELPKNWLKGLNIETQITSIKYNKEINKYKVKCGTSLEQWELKNWIHPQDPYGWFQWYCRFYMGRRSSDDERQIKRWINFAGINGRWKINLINKIKSNSKKFENFTSPVIRQSLLHWGYELTESDFKSFFLKK